MWLTFVCFLFRSQLVDLKAELYRKQEQFKKDKLGQGSAASGLKAKDKVSSNVFSGLKFILLCWGSSGAPAGHSCVEAKHLEQTEPWCFGPSPEGCRAAGRGAERPGSVQVNMENLVKTRWKCCSLTLLVSVEQTQVGRKGQTVRANDRRRLSRWVTLVLHHLESVSDEDRWWHHH